MGAKMLPLLFIPLWYGFSITWYQKSLFGHFFYKILSFAKKITTMFLAISWVCVYILKALRKDPGLSTSFWWPQAFPSWKMAPSSCLFMSSSFSGCQLLGSNFPLLKDTSHVGLKPFRMTSFYRDYRCISKQRHILRYWRLGIQHIFFGGHYLTHYSGVGEVAWEDIYRNDDTNYRNI